MLVGIHCAALPSLHISSWAGAPCSRECVPPLSVASFDSVPSGIAKTSVQSLGKQWYVPIHASGVWIVRGRSTIEVLRFLRVIAYVAYESACSMLATMWRQKKYPCCDNVYDRSHSTVLIKWLRPRRSIFYILHHVFNLFSGKKITAIISSSLCPLPPLRVCGTGSQCTHHNDRYLRRCFEGVWHVLDDLQTLSALQEKMQYRLHDRTRDMHDDLVSCQTKVSQ